MELSPQRFDACASLVWGRHWKERLGRRLKIRPREFDEMLSGNREIPRDAVDAVLEGLKTRREALDDAVLELAGADQ
ncbi:MAG: hypothetical protein CMQ40_10885 [Gammaproteobacteria bacterium]|nr:hypothetical protein [Gammaproteobacteria bacterium]|tara:strand:+ start:278 stop:508 length:231 start_codon:yes stop_codon:yes gene_type:complete